MLGGILPILWPQERGLVSVLLAICLPLILWPNLGCRRGREAEVGESVAQREAERAEGPTPRELEAGSDPPQRVVYTRLRPSGLAFSPDGKRIAVASGRWNTRGEIQLWDVASRKLAATARERRGVASVAFSPDTARVASCGWDGLVKIRDVATLEVTVTIPLESVARLAFSPDGKTLATGSQGGSSDGPPGGKVELWDAASGSKAGQCEGVLSLVRCVGFSPDGALIAAASDLHLPDRAGRLPDWDVVFWEAKTGKRTRVLTVNEWPVVSLAFSPDGKVLATGGRRMLRLWEVASGKLKATLEVPEEGGWVGHVAFSPDGKMLATGGGHSALRLWDAATGALLASSGKDTEGPDGLAFSRGGETLVTVHREGGLRQWDTAAPPQSGVLIPSAVLLDPQGPFDKPRPVETAAMSARLVYYFRERFEPESFRFVGGANPIPGEKVEEGLRFTIPEGGEIGYCGVDPKIVVRGDFQITAGFAIRDLPRPKQGYGAGLKIHIEDSRKDQAAIQRLNRQREGHVFLAYRGELQRDGTREHLVASRKTEAKSGWLRLRRDGTTLRHLVAEAESDHFTQICESEYPADDVVTLHFAVQTGGAATGVDVVWTYLDVQAEKLPKRSTQ